MSIMSNVKRSGRQAGKRRRAEVRPSVECAGGDARVQIEQKLVREAGDGRRLAKRQAHADGFFELHAFAGDRLVFQQHHETGAPGVRPNIGAQQVAQFQARAKGDLALADPFQNAVAPLPLRDEAQILVGQVDGQIHLAAIHFKVRNGTIEGGRRDHIFGVDQVVGHANHAIQASDIGAGANQERGQFVGFFPRYLYELAVSNNIHDDDLISLSTTRSQNFYFN